MQLSLTSSRDCTWRRSGSCWSVRWTAVTRSSSSDVWPGRTAHSSRAQATRRRAARGNSVRRPTRCLSDGPEAGTVCQTGWERCVHLWSILRCLIDCYARVARPAYSVCQTWVSWKLQCRVSFAFSDPKAYTVCKQFKLSDKISTVRLRQPELGRGIMLSNCPSILTSSILWLRQFENELLQSGICADEVLSFWGQEVKVQGHTTPNLDLETWRRCHSRPIRSSRLS